MAIRYDKNLQNEITRVVRNFNNKINRLEKLQNDLILPDKITKKSLTERYYTRKDLQRKLNELKRFSTRGIEKTIETKAGLKLSEYELINLPFLLCTSQPKHSNNGLIYSSRHSVSLYAFLASR